MAIKVSIIVPVYNVEKYISKCLTSLCNQTLKDIEIITINDKSTDSSLDILKQFAKKDARIKIINKTENQKTAKARNNGIDIAQGEYLAFVDGDDYIDLDFCEKLYKTAKQNNADIAKAMVRVMDENSIRQNTFNNDSVEKNGKFFFWGRMWSAIYNREKLINKYQIKFFIDFFCFQIQAVYYSNKVACCNNTYYNYVRHENSCDSDIFTLEKWQRLNLGHANFIYQWVNTHFYNQAIYNFYLEKVKSLYFYGFNKLEIKDIPIATHILAENMQNYYNCGFNIKNIKKLRRKLFRLNHKTTFKLYIKNIIENKI